MADVKFDCTHCGEHLEAEEQMRGKKMQCPACKSEVMVPAQAVPEPALPVARLADSQATPPGPAAPAEEQEVFDIKPTAAAFLGHILLGIVVALLGVAVVLFVRWAYGTWYKETIGRNVQAGIVLGPIVVGLVMLLRVWFHMASLHYRLTTQRLFVRRGLIAKHISELELFRIKDVTVNQTLFQRILGFGTITVLSADDANPEVDMVGIRNPVEVKETIRNHYRAARKREGVASTEFSPS